MNVVPESGVFKKGKDELWVVWAIYERTLLSNIPYHKLFNFTVNRISKFKHWNATQNRLIVISENRPSHHVMWKVVSSENEAIELRDWLVPELMQLNIQKMRTENELLHKNEG